MTVYGPHCPHPECGWLGCDLAEDGDGILYPCRNQATCPYCGNPSENPAPAERPRWEWTCPYGCAVTVGTESERLARHLAPGQGQRHMTAVHGGGDPGLPVWSGPGPDPLNFAVEVEGCAR